MARMLKGNGGPMATGKAGKSLRSGSNKGARGRNGVLNGLNPMATGKAGKQVPNGSNMGTKARVKGT